MITTSKKTMSDRLVTPSGNAPALRTAGGLSVLAMTVLMAGCGAMGMGPAASGMHAGHVDLSGAGEVPAVTSTATGSGMITVGPDHAVSGSVSTTGIEGTAAHIHMASKGSNGPVVLPLAKTAEGTWSVPAGARLTDAQYAGYKAGDLYVNVHSAAHPGGEIRGQLGAQ